MGYAASPLRRRLRRHRGASAERSACSPARVSCPGGGAASAPARARVNYRGESREGSFSARPKHRGRVRIDPATTRRQNGLVISQDKARPEALSKCPPERTVFSDSRCRWCQRFSGVLSSSSSRSAITLNVHSVAPARPRCPLDGETTATRREARVSAFSPRAWSTRQGPPRTLDERPASPRDRPGRPS